MSATSDSFHSVTAGNCIKVGGGGLSTMQHSVGVESVLPAGCASSSAYRMRLLSGSVEYDHSRTREPTAMPPRASLCKQIHSCVQRCHLLRCANLSSDCVLARCKPRI